MRATSLLLLLASLLTPSVVLAAQHYSWDLASDRNGRMASVREYSANSRSERYVELHFYEAGGQIGNGDRIHGSHGRVAWVSERQGSGFFRVVWVNEHDNQILMQDFRVESGTVSAGLVQVVASGQNYPDPINGEDQLLDMPDVDCVSMNGIGDVAVDDACVVTFIAGHDPDRVMIESGEIHFGAMNGVFDAPPPSALFPIDLNGNNIGFISPVVAVYGGFCASSGCRATMLIAAGTGGSWDEIRVFPSPLDLVAGDWVTRPNDPETFRLDWARNPVLADGDGEYAMLAYEVSGRRGVTSGVVATGFLYTGEPTSEFELPASAPGETGWGWCGGQSTVQAWPAVAAGNGSDDFVFGWSELRVGGTTGSLVPFIANRFMRFDVWGNELGAAIGSSSPSWPQQSRVGDLSQMAVTTESSGQVFFAHSYGGRQWWESALMTF